MNESRTEFKPEWKVDKTFKKENVQITVSKSNHHIPHYRMEVSFQGRDDVFVRSLAIFDKEGAVNTANPAETIGALVEDAWAYVKQEVSVNFEAHQAARANRPRTQGSEGRPGLKALSKRDRKAWQERGGKNERA